jgi:hypothetical protein
VFKKKNCDYKSTRLSEYPIEICSCSDQTLGGINCEVRLCYNDCTGNGHCTKEGVCVCKQGFLGADCSILLIKMGFVSSCAEIILMAGMGLIFMII